MKSEQKHKGSAGANLSDSWKKIAEVIASAKALRWGGVAVFENQAVSIECLGWGSSVTSCHSAVICVTAFVLTGKRNFYKVER